MPQKKHVKSEKGKFQEIFLSGKIRLRDYMHSRIYVIIFIVPVDIK